MARMGSPTVDSEASRKWLGLGATLQGAADDIGVGRPQKAPVSTSREPRSLLEQFDDFVTNRPLRSASRKLYLDGHFARAVEEAFKCLNNEVRAKAGLISEDGATLMRKAFSPKSPTLGLNSLTTQNDRSEQEGYMNLFVGVMVGIRNPRAHDHQLQDDPDVALEMIVFANHLMRKLDSSAKVKGC